LNRSQFEGCLSICSGANQAYYFLVGMFWSLSTVPVRAWLGLIPQQHR
jgi:hypothetical protein